MSGRDSLRGLNDLVDLVERLVDNHVLVVLEVLVLEFGLDGEVFSGLPLDLLHSFVVGTGKFFVQLVVVHVDLGVELVSDFFEELVVEDAVDAGLVRHKFVDSVDELVVGTQHLFEVLVDHLLQLVPVLLHVGDELRFDHLDLLGQLLPLELV